MKINVLYDQGSAHTPEDGIIFQPPYYFGVIDGISGIYLPQEGPRLFDGITGGQLASHAISQAFGSTLTTEKPLEDIFQEANNMIHVVSETYGLPFQKSEFLPSAAFVVAKIGISNISILQGGDSLAIWQMKDGTIEGTPNKAYAYEEKLLRIIAELMKKHERDRQKMWEEFCPILREERRANINTEQGGFALLNGQPAFKNFWQEFTLPLEKMALLILFSDGFVPFEWTQNRFAMAGEIIRLYQKEGLHSILKATRLIADQNKSSSHEDYPEATAIAIGF